MLFKVLVEVDIFILLIFFVFLFVYNIIILYICNTKKEVIKAFDVL